jgi:predicted anti-sigma-YlaC factor YlaD
MKHEKIIKYFIRWLEGKLSQEKKREIDQHLKECQSCQRYYQEMQEILQNPDADHLPHLEADPYLPTRIRSGQVRPEPATIHKPLFDGLRWSVVTALLFIGISLGAFTGYSLFQTENGTDEELVTGYYQAFTQGQSVFEQAEILNLQNGEDK